MIHLIHTFIGPQTIVTLLLALLILAIIYTFIPSQTPTGKSTYKRDSADYDFMSTYESIPSHYDLALAYIASGLTDKGRHKLTQVAGSKHPIYAAKAAEKIAELQKQDKSRESC